MRLDRNTLAFFSPEGKKALISTLIKGLNNQMDSGDPEDREFLDCCAYWRDTLLLKPDYLWLVVTELNESAGDMFGTEGWEKGLGLPT